MNTIIPIDAIATSPLQQSFLPPTRPVNLVSNGTVSGFADILSAGIQSVNEKIDTADSLVRRFTLGEQVPIHQVTSALEEARLAIELTTQVRSRLVETYRDFMTMQV